MISSERWECISHGLGLRHPLDTGYKLKRAVDCDLTELESVLDYFAPTNERKGNWKHNPHPQDQEGIYRACYETLRQIDLNTELTTAQYIQKALANKEEGSSEIFQLIVTLAGYLITNESGEDHKVHQDSIS